MASQLKDVLRMINLKTFKTSNMSIIRFYNSGVPCYRDESADEAYEGLIRQFNSGYHGYYPKQVPAANVSETDLEYSLSIALPGVDKKDIQIQHERGYLTVRVEKSSETSESAQFTRHEFDYTGASRVFRTGEKIDSERITAGYENGILTIHLPKREAFIPKPAKLISVE